MSMPFAGIPGLHHLPNGYTIDPIRCSSPRLTLGPVHVLIDLSAVPGFGNTTGAPSSGSQLRCGWWPGLKTPSAMVPGGWNQARRRCWVGFAFSTPARCSRVLNFGSGMSGAAQHQRVGRCAGVGVGLWVVGQQSCRDYWRAGRRCIRVWSSLGLADGVGQWLGNVGTF